MSDAARKVQFIKFECEAVGIDEMTETSAKEAIASFFADNASIVIGALERYLGSTAARISGEVMLP